MRIDRKLNLVIPLDRGDQGNVYVHSMPLGAETVEKYSLILAKVFAVIYREGLSVVSGPRIAAMQLKSIAQAREEWDGPEGVEAGLLGEMIRLSSVIAMGPKGWAPMPLETALNKGLLSAEEASEVKGLVCFFMLTSALNRSAEARVTLDTISKLWDVQTTYSSITEYTSSLPTLTPDETTGEKATQPSIVS